MIFATFYTMNSPYAECASAWASSLDALGLRYMTIGIPPCSWKDAVMQTGEMCRKVWTANGAEMIVFTDADAEVVRSPELLLELEQSKDYDIACHWLNPGGMYADPPGSRECLNGTVAVWPTALAGAVLLEWEYLNQTKREARCADQLNLDAAIKESGARALDLPPEYCWISDTSLSIYGSRDPVIVQHQASRKYRKANPG